MSNNINDPERKLHQLSKNIIGLYAFVFVSALIFIVRLWYLQIIQGEQLKLFSDKNRIKTQVVRATRGRIYDRQGKVLADNKLDLQLFINPETLSKDNKALLFSRISKIIEIPSKKLEKKYTKSVRKNGRLILALIKSQLTDYQALKLSQLRVDYPEVFVEYVQKRHYTLKQKAAHLTGYVSLASKAQIKSERKVKLTQGDLKGQSGAEKIYDRQMRGSNGEKTLQVNAWGRSQDLSFNYLKKSSIKPIQALTGNHIQLTIDKELQELAFDSFYRDDHIGERFGSVVALKTNGEILAFVNKPSYNPNEFIGGIASELWKNLRTNPLKPLRNKAVQDHYPPGSTMKPFVALAALKNGIITPDSKVHSPSYFKCGRRKFHDHTKTGQGYIGVQEALEKSSNVFFYKMAFELGVNKMFEVAKSFRFGIKPDLKFVNMARGFFPTTEWYEKRTKNKWIKCDDLNQAIGQGFVLVSPIQMALAYQGLANEGRIYKPYLHKKTFSSQDGSLLTENVPELIEDMTRPNEPNYISKENFKTVKQGLYQVANGPRGTARWWKLKNGIEFSGKTGTAQVRSFSSKEIYKKCMNRPLTDRHHGWFIGYAPAENPEIVVAVLSLHSCAGSSGSAPIARDIFDKYFEGTNKPTAATTTSFHLRESHETL